MRQGHAVLDGTRACSCGWIKSRLTERPTSPSPCKHIHKPFQRRGKAPDCCCQGQPLRLMALQLRHGHQPLSTWRLPCQHRWHHRRHLRTTRRQGGQTQHRNRQAICVLGRIDPTRVLLTSRVSVSVVGHLVSKAVASGQRGSNQHGRCCLLPGSVVEPRR